MRKTEGPIYEVQWKMGPLASLLEFLQNGILSLFKRRFVTLTTTKKSHLLIEVEGQPLLNW